MPSFLQVVANPSSDGKTGNDFAPGYLSVGRRSDTQDAFEDAYSPPPLPTLELAWRGPSELRAARMPPQSCTPAPLVLRTGAGPTQRSPTQEKYSIGFLVGDSSGSSSTTSSSSSSYGYRANGNSGKSKQGSSSVPQVHVRPHKGSATTKHYRLLVVQHPEKSAEYGSSTTLSRLPLSPPLVVQLFVVDGAGNPIHDESEIPFLVAHLSIFSGDGRYALDLTPGSAGASRLLYGNLVSSPHRLRDLQGKQGVFFLFPDVSVRERGQYQLGVTLMSLASFAGPPGLVAAGAPGSVLAHARTRPFSVVEREGYVAPPQTALTQYLMRQGVRMYAFSMGSP